MARRMICHQLEFCNGRVYLGPEYGFSKRNCDVEEENEMEIFATLVYLDWKNLHVEATLKAEVGL